jgi:putative two-component system response regulator
MVTRNRTILIIDDDRDILRLMEIFLQSQKYAVITAEDGEKDFQQAKTLHPDLIIADLTMPGLNGWQLSLKLKTDEKLKKIPIIILSAMVDKEALPEVGEAGDFYLPKPVDLDKLLTKITELLSAE